MCQCGVKKSGGEEGRRRRTDDASACDFAPATLGFRTGRRPSVGEETRLKPFAFDVAPFARHGGALDQARAFFPMAPEPWIDLSTGINPIAYPLGPMLADAWTRLPEAAALAGLERTAAARYGVAAGSAIVAAPGTQAIIQHLPLLCAGENIRVAGPTYGEYARVFREAGARVHTVPDVAALAGADVAVVVNPNNPDGRIAPLETLLTLAGRVGTLVVDEAFMDALSLSIVPRLASNRIVVLRSFGKMYGLAGIRLGFAIASPERAERLRAKLGPWAVSGPAIALGTAALADDAWLAGSRARLKSDGARLNALLRSIGASEIGSTPLFRLGRHTGARDGRRDDEGA